MNRAQSSDALDLETALPLPLAHFQRVALLGELTASLAHEINQPLAAIMANAHAASAMLAARKESRSAVRETVRDIAENAKHAAAIVSRLRSLLRREAPVFVAIDVAKCVDDAVEFASAEIARRCIVVRRFPVAAHLVEGDAVQLQQVFLNLLMNACDAIDRGPAGQREITVYVARSSPNRIEVAIRDSGCGFEGEELDRIFDHFVSTKPHGLGMGLAISKSIVQAHGGRIWASRNSTGGLTLHVALPLCAESWDHENPRNGLCRR